MKKLKLGTIEEEATACRLAFEGFAVGGIVLHCHHESLFERLTKPAEGRINYILADKPEHERALRLHLFRPIREEVLNEWLKADAEWVKAEAGRRKAEAEWVKAGAEWRKAD